MHDLSVIKNAVYQALDDSEEPESMRQAASRSIVGPTMVLEMVEALEQRPDAERVDELMQLLRELTEYVEKQSGEDARILTMQAKVLL